MKHQAAIAVHRIDHFLHRAQAGDHHGNLVLDANGQVGLQARVAAMHDQVDRVGRGVHGQAAFDFLQPGFEAAAFTLVQRGETADDAAVATRKHQLRIGDQKHRRGHDWQTQALFEQGGKAHGDSPWRLEGFDDDQDDDGEQRQYRCFIEPTIKHMTALIFAAGKAFELGTADVVIGDQ